MFKVGLNYFLIGIPEINIKGAVFGTAFFYLLCIFINYAVLRKETGVRIDIKTVIVKPFVAAVLCGVAAWGSYTLLSSVLTFGDMNSRLNGNSLACLIAIGVAVVVYAISALLLKTLVKNDILLLPKGEKIAEILEKYKLIV